MDSTSERSTASRLIQPCEAAILCGVSARSLRRWNEQGLIAARKTPGGHRRYSEDEVRALSEMGQAAS